MREHDPFRGELPEMRTQGLVVKVVADRPVEGVRLGRQQVSSARRLGQRWRPLSVPGVGEARAAELDPQRQGRGAAGMLDLPPAHARRANHRCPQTGPS